VAAVGNLFQAGVDALKGSDDHPKDPYHEDIEDPPDGEHRKEVDRKKFSHGY
jgi:hypothetical protein